MTGALMPAETYTNPTQYTLIMKIFQKAKEILPNLPIFSSSI